MRALAFMVVLTLSGCWHSAIIEGRKVDDPPKCLMTFFGEPGCWADGQWYAQCPWVMNDRYHSGYYAFENGFWREHRDHQLRDPNVGPPPEEWCVDGASPSSELLNPPTRVR